MAKNNIEMVLCRTCVRDNCEEGFFQNFDEAAQFYKDRLNLGLFRKAARLKYQNCFAQCENFFCLQVSRNNKGFLLKKISSPEKIDSVIDWVKESSQGKDFQLPQKLEENLIRHVEVSEKYQKC